MNDLPTFKERTHIVRRYALQNVDKKLATNFHEFYKYKSPAVSQIFAQALELSPNKFCASRTILPEYSNMSSATLLFMLERLIALDHPQPGDYGILIGFGAGLTLEFVLLQW